MSSNYMLYIVGNPSNVYQSLEEAKQAAESHIENKCTLRIENPAAPAPTRTWGYDYKAKDWVENYEDQTLSITLGKNPKWESIAVPSAGEIAHLQYFDGLPYELQVKISCRNNDSFSGEILRVFAGGELAGEIKKDAEILDRLLSKHIIFDRTNIFAASK